MRSPVLFIPYRGSLSELESVLLQRPSDTRFISIGAPGTSPALYNLSEHIERDDLVLVESGEVLCFRAELVDAFLPFPRQSTAETLSPAQWLIPIAERMGRVRVNDDSGKKTRKIPHDRATLRAFVKGAVSKWETSRYLENELSRRFSELAARNVFLKESKRTKSLVELEKWAGFAASTIRSRTYQPARKSADFRDGKSSRTLSISLDRTSRDIAFNILVPHLKFNQVFGGMATALKLGIALAKLGHKVRLICTDSPLSAEQRSAFDRYLAEKQASDVTAKFELWDASAGNDVPSVPMGHRDILIATAWWTALLADRCLRSNDFRHREFVYLIQDFEPGFYPWSRDYALAESTYRLPTYRPIFNTGFLKDYFRKNGIADTKHGWTLRPEIDFERFHPRSSKRVAPERARILIYGRPSVPRNLFSLIVAGIDEWVRTRDISAEAVDIVSAGERHGDIHFPNRIKMRSVGLIDSAAYPEFLRECDIGISLMLSPHPSYPPLEMAASGQLTLTNAYATKDLTSISTNFIESGLNPESIAEALDAAIRRVADYESRISGSRLRLPQESSVEEVAAAIIGTYPGSRRKAAEMNKTYPELGH